MKKRQLRVWGSLATTVSLNLISHVAKPLSIISAYRNTFKVVDTQTLPWKSHLSSKSVYVDLHCVALGICITASKIPHAGYAAHTKACAAITSFTFENGVSATETTVVYPVHVADIVVVGIVADVAPVIVSA
ncbi:hypothetical protein GN244_ATG01727 [Phytophthora infestans]|uniref:Uncharacterized protein n=1 Tax=Phytophthora infestans TaxID=4787 RepID=A0A833TMG2_PHYIN|nr:hypothetical protein GN244_ATG01727 [Phytophthora infestans]KAF4133572.1 hypothetical protein GN958_ATG16909 [Phytophthora infestans]